MVKRQCVWFRFLNILLFSIMRIETPEVSTIKKIVVIAATNVNSQTMDRAKGGQQWKKSFFSNL